VATAIVVVTVGDAATVAAIAVATAPHTSLTS